MAFCRVRVAQGCSGIRQLITFALALGSIPVSAGAASVSARDYPNLQAAVDANPGGTIDVPHGDYAISKTLRLDRDGTCLVGPGRLIMSNPEAAIIEVEHASRVRIEGLTLTRAEGALDTAREGLVARDAKDLQLREITVVDNRTRSGSIRLEQVSTAAIIGCTVTNYSKIAVDDRMSNPDLYGYAFRCIDGSGIVVVDSRNVLIQGNTIREENLRPTREVQAAHQLGSFVKQAPTRGKLVSQATWDAKAVNNWHQGSALIVTGPRTSRNIRILGNQIENAAQGIDLHADQVIVSGNIVNDAFIGMKAMHGSRNILISGNQFLRNDLWSIGLMPGVASGVATPAAGDSPALSDNSDGGSIIANNIVSQFGEGSSAWNWKDASRAPLRFDRGQEADDPPLSGVVVSGNVIDAGPGRANGDYDFAVRIEAGSERSPVGLMFHGNLFPAGSRGVSNVDLPR
jgi:hypothetical protein